MRSRARRGNAIVVGLLFGTLLGFSALSIDIGLVRVGQTQLQAAIDSSALSGAGALDGKLTGIVSAKVTAVQIAQANHVLGSPVSVTLSEVEVGTWDDTTDQFTPWNGVDAPDTVNAVRIVHTPAPLSSVLAAAAFGIGTLGVHAEAVAIRPVAAGPARSSECFLPIAVPDCWLSGLAPGANPPPFKFTFSPSPTDKIAWGDPDTNPNSSDINAQLMGSCDGGEIEVDDPIYVNEGNHATSTMLIADILNDRTAIEPTTWDSALYGPLPARDGGNDTANTIPRSAVNSTNWGNTLEGPVALVDAGGDCSTVSFTGSHPMTGVAWAVIYDVSKPGSDLNIYIQLDLVNEHDIWGEVGDPSDVTGLNVLANGEPQLAIGG